MAVGMVTGLDVGGGVDMVGSNSVKVQSPHDEHSLCIRPKAERQCRWVYVVWVT